MTKTRRRAREGHRLAAFVHSLSDEALEDMKASCRRPHIVGSNRGRRRVPIPEKVERVMSTPFVMGVMLLAFLLFLLLHGLRGG